MILAIMIAASLKVREGRHGGLAYDHEGLSQAPSCLIWTISGNPVLTVYDWEAYLYLAPPVDRKFT
jgi:hypothetical protein